MKNNPSEKILSDNSIPGLVDGEKYLSIALIFLAFIILWVYLYAPVFDGDIWFHLLYGKAIMENHTLIPDHTIYSWTLTNSSSIYCAWLGQIIYYTLYKIAGINGIIIFRYVMVSLFFVALFFLARQRNSLYNPLTSFVAVLCILVMGPATLDKPELLSFLFMTIIVLNWFIIKQLKKYVIFNIYLFPLLILVWVNTHGGFVFGCIFLFCIGLGETLNQFLFRNNCLPKKLYIHLITALLISVIAIFITPYGYNYIQFLILSYFDANVADDVSKVQAYQRTFNTKRLDSVIFADIAIVLVVIVFITSFRKKQLDFVPIISNILFASIFTWYVRSTLYWIPVFSFSIIYYANIFLPASEIRKKIYFYFLIIFQIVLSGFIISQERCTPTKEQWLEFGLSERYAIDEEINFITTNFPKAKLGNLYGHGSYILWKLWPDTKVMIDARYFPFKDWYQEYVKFRNGLDVESFIQKYPFDVMEIDHDASALILWFFKSSDWRLAFFGKGGVIFVRKDIIQSDKITKGEGLANIKSYRTARNVLNTSLILKDWSTANIVLSTLKNKFSCSSQQKIISEIEIYKLGLQKFDEKQYKESIDYLEKSMNNKISDPPMLAAALLMKAIEEWHGDRWNSALKYAIKSAMIQKSFAATYNITLMAWQMATHDVHKEKLEELSGREKEIVKSWRAAFSNLIKNKDGLPEKYSPFIENANIILNKEGISSNTLLLEPDWL